MAASSEVASLVVPSSVVSVLNISVVVVLPASAPSSAPPHEAVANAKIDMPVATKILRAMLICVSLFQPRLAVVMIDQATRIAVASQLPAAADPDIFDEAPCASRSRNAGSLALRHSFTSVSAARSDQHPSEL